MSPRRLNPPSFNTSHLIAEVQDLLDIPWSQQWKARQIVQIILKSMRQALQNGSPVIIPGFGKFIIHETPPYLKPNAYITSTERSPVPLLTHHKHKIIFRPCQQLRAMLNADAPVKSVEEARAMRNWPTQS